MSTHFRTASSYIACWDEQFNSYSPDTRRKASSVPYVLPVDLFRWNMLTDVSETANKNVMKLLVAVMKFLSGDVRTDRQTDKRM